MKKNNLSNFLFEATTLKRLKRTGWQILGGNEESIAEHSYMVCVISYALARLLHTDVEKVILMALFHDFTEARVGDIYKLSDLYVTADEKRAASDAFSNLVFGGDLEKIVQEYEDRESVESKVVHDADTLALCVELKQLMEKGNIHAKEWFDANIQALSLAQSKAIAEQLKFTNSQDWWKKEREIIHKGYKK